MLHFFAAVPSQQQAAMGPQEGLAGGLLLGLCPSFSVGDRYIHPANLLGSWVSSACLVGWLIIAALTGGAQGWGLSLTRPELLVLHGLTRRECKGMGCGSVGSWLGAGQLGGVSSAAGGCGSQGRLPFPAQLAARVALREVIHGADHGKCGHRHRK